MQPALMAESEDTRRDEKPAGRDRSRSPVRDDQLSWSQSRPTDIPYTAEAAAALTAAIENTNGIIACRGEIQCVQFNHTM